MPEPTPAASPRRTRLNAADRRASILAAATEVFAEAGYQRAKMSDVAGRVGVSEPVVFQNFGSKAAVFAAVLDTAALRATQMMREWAAASGSTGAWLTQFLAPDHLTQVHARGTLSVLFSDAMALAADPTIARAARNANQAVAEVLTELLARGQQDGSVRPDLDPATAAWWLLSLLASQGFRHAASSEAERVEAGLAEMTLRLLTTPERS
ncbi:TetR/AcrR family transcriptional regulator [Kitasatospora sp. NPDC085879]|uniref:TetR/AcrR family transcriptional regulator n=1 Tax=Kitasatospora sp. NPDC085879 TaxID=3154769 RepID=UPI003412CFA0